MIRLNPWGHYRGPGGADPEKSREQRERELFGMMESPDGPEIILFLSRLHLAIILQDRSNGTKPQVKQPYKGSPRCGRGLVLRAR